MKKSARNHHFISQGYLAGFTEEGTRDSRLHVYDLASHSVFQTKPRNVGAERDFNRIDVDGQDPDVLERALGEFEGKAISIIRGIRTSGTLPNDVDFSYVLNLMALFIVRNPRRRRQMNDARHNVVRVIGDLLTSDKRLFEHHMAQAKENGFVPQDAEVAFPELGQFIRDDQFTTSVSTSESLWLELGGFDHALRLLGSRYWSLVTAGVGAPDFVTCDHPVTPVFKDSKRHGPIGYELPETEVSFPLNTRQALLGVFKDPLALSIKASAGQVAAINGRTICHAARQVYSKTASVAVLKGGKLSILR